VQSGFSPNVSSDFLRLVTRNFAPGRLLLIGKEAMQLAEQPALKGLVSSCAPTLSALEEAQLNGSSPPFDVAIWFYSAEAAAPQENAMIARLARLSDQLILLPGAGTNPAKRRPRLVTALSSHGFLPNYDSELVEIEPAAVHLSRSRTRSLDSLLPEIESGFARLNAQLRAAQRALRTRMAELQTADQHIARLEEKVLKLKEAKRDLKQLKAEKQALRKSPERKIGQVILAPYRLPQRLYRTMRRRFADSAAAKRRASSPNQYEKWLQRHSASSVDLARMREESRAFPVGPLISVITPVHNTHAPWLKEAVDSVRQQAYENWELMLIDDGSTAPETLQFLAELEGSDSRIRILRLDQSQGISAASNAGIEAAHGDWLGFLDHDDLLEPDALYQTAKWLQENPETDVIYSDEDKLTEEGLGSPCLKPDWSPDFFLSYNYICHFTTVRRELVRELGGFRSKYDFAQDYDLYLRLMSHTRRIHHVPRVLYHWRRSAGSTSINIRAKPEALDAARNALAAYLLRAGEAGHVTVDWNTHAFRIRRELSEENRIAIIIPTRDRVDLLARCLTSITEKTSYEPYEIVIVDNDSQTPEARAFLEQTRHRVLRFSGPFNYSAINNFAVEKTDAPWLLFLNNDTEVIDGDWLTAMAEHVQRPEVGAVGAQLRFRNETIQHAGIVLGVRGTAKHAFCGFPADSPGVCRQLQVVRNYSAVTAACLLTRRQVFEEVGGFDEERLPVIFNDVDLCLKMRSAGYLVVYTPWAKLYHDESATRRASVEPPEAEILRQRWPEVVKRDPYYNPNLSRDQADFSLGE
jgi:O-antigen biosynthesis protein